jgi:predicted PurR-regulated permease PerM
MKTRIEIDTNTFVRFWLVLIGFALVLLAVYSARTALILLALAFFFALALNVPVNYLASHLPGKSRVAGTAVAYVAIVVALAAFVFLAVPPIIEQTGKFIQTVPALSSKATTQWDGLGVLIDQYHLQPQIDKAVASMQENWSDWAANAGRNAIQGAGSVIAFGTSTVFVLVLTFLMLVEGPLWLDRVWGLYTDTARMKRHRQLAYQMYRVVTGFVTGQLAVAAIGAVLAGIAVFILSFFFELPANLALPTIAITFTLSLIPMFGATLAGLLVALLLAFNSVSAAIIYIIYFFVYQQIENNFISPLIQSKRLELSALTVLIAVTVGFYTFGILGSLISIPIAGSIKVLLSDYLKEAQQDRAEGRRPMARLASKLQSKS